MKKNKIIKMLLSIFILHTTMAYSTENIISMFIEQYPLLKEMEAANQSSETVSKSLMQPKFTNNISSYRIPKPGIGVEGINVSYLGFITVSNQNGQVSFPNKQQTTTVNLLVTPRLRPIFMIAPTTIHHWELHPSMPAELYSIEQKYDSTTGLYYLKTTKIDLPKNKEISLNTIIVFATPEEIFVPEGATITKYTTNLTLPPIYQKEVNKTERALYTLSIKEYFEQINEIYKNGTTEVSTMIANT